MTHEIEKPENSLHFSGIKIYQSEFLKRGDVIYIKDGEIKQFFNYLNTPIGDGKAIHKDQLIKNGWYSGYGSRDFCIALWDGVHFNSFSWKFNKLAHKQTDYSDSGCFVPTMFLGLNKSTFPSGNISPNEYNTKNKHK